MQNFIIHNLNYNLNCLTKKFVKQFLYVKICRTKVLKSKTNLLKYDNNYAIILLKIHVKFKI